MRSFFHSHTPWYKVVFPLPSLPHCLCISSVSLGAILLSVICRLSLGCVTLELLFWGWVSSDFTYFRLLWNPIDPCATVSQSELAVCHLSMYCFFPDWKLKFSFSSKSIYWEGSHTLTPSIVGRASLSCKMCTCCTLYSNNATLFPSSLQPPTACNENSLKQVCLF